MQIKLLEIVGLEENNSVCKECKMLFLLKEKQYFRTKFFRDCVKVVPEGDRGKYRKII